MWHASPTPPRSCARACSSKPPSTSSPPLIGLGVDNIIVEIDNLEVPILDGSSLPYVSAILATGLKRQRRKREYIRILKPIEVREGSPSGDKFIGVYPGDGYSIHYAIDFPEPIGRDTFTGDLEAGAYADLIAPARTFGFKEDEAMLRDMGLIRGVSNDSRHHRHPAPPPPQTGTILNGPLRFPTNSSATKSSTSSATSLSPAVASGAASSPRRRTRRPRHAHRPRPKAPPRPLRLGTNPPLRTPLTPQAFTPRAFTPGSAVTFPDDPPVHPCLTKYTVISTEARSV